MRNRRPQAAQCTLEGMISIKSLKRRPKDATQWLRLTFDELT